MCSDGRLNRREQGRGMLSGRGGEGRGLLSPRVFTVELWKGEKCQKCSKSRLVKVVNEKCAKGFGRSLHNTKYNETERMT